MGTALSRVVAIFLFSFNCAAGIANEPGDAAPQITCASALLLGAHPDTTKKQIQFRVYSKHATTLEVLLFADPHGQPLLNRKMKRDPATDVWLATVSFSDMERAGMKIGEVGKAAFPYPFYAYRAWGPNWTKQMDIGDDFDSDGNRFNPNKALIDPYGLEVSHDMRVTPSDTDEVYLTGRHRMKSSLDRVPKSVIMPFPKGATVSRPERAFKNEVIYELHVRGMTMLAPGVPSAEQGTYLGLKRIIPYLKELGVTAVELMPVFDFSDDANQEMTTEGNNFWGYDPMNFFSPNRRFGSDAAAKRAGGVTEEFVEMADALHAADIKLYLDVVYNHTAEGGIIDGDGKVSKIVSWRGLDNRSYYQVGDGGEDFQDNTGCGGNMNSKNPVWRQMVLDSMRYWVHLGTDGFRFDLAPVLGNTFESGYDFSFDKMEEQNVFNRALVELPGRPIKGGRGVDLIAEPWGVGPGTYQLGNFPFHPGKKFGDGKGMSEWNDKFRSLVRRAENKWGVDSPTPGEMAAGLAGSQSVFQGGLKGPWASVNYAVSHDGMTLKDLNSKNAADNEQGYPYGPTDGGDSNNVSWDHSEHGDTPDLRARRQRQGARNMLALTLLAYGGVPMIRAGDEVLATQNGNNNAYRIDSPGTWFPWPKGAVDLTDAIGEIQKTPFFQMTRNLIAFRSTHESFRPLAYATGTDKNGNGLKDLSWFQANGKSAEDADLPDDEKGYMADAWKGYLGMRIDADEHGDKDVRSIYVAYNWSHRNLRLTLPEPAAGKKWYWQGDTDSEYESIGNFLPPGKEKPLTEVIPAKGSQYPMRGRTVAVFLEK